MQKISVAKCELVKVGVAGLMRGTGMFAMICVVYGYSIRHAQSVYCFHTCAKDVTELHHCLYYSNTSSDGRAHGQNQLLASIFDTHIL